MKDYESVLVENKKGELLSEHKRLEEELFKRMPFREKIHAYIFAIAYVGAIFFGIWFVGYITYALIFKRS